MSEKIINKIIYTILIISIFLGIYRIFPYFSNNIPLGYDPGLYRLLFLDYGNNLPNISFSNLTDRTKLAYPPFLGFLGNILQIIGFKIENLLSFGLGFFSLITSILIYLNLKKYSRITAIIGVSIFLISIIQYQSFWWNYYKQIIGVIFMLSSFYLLEKQKYTLSIPVIIGLFTIHRPSGVYFLITYIIYKLLNYIFSKEKFNINDSKKEIYIILGTGIMSILIYIPVFQEQILGLIKPLFTTALTDGQSGTFFSKADFGKYNIFIILASIYGLYINIEKKKFDIITSGYIAGMIWVGFGLFFYNRFYIFFDIFIILMAAYSFGKIYKQNHKYFLHILLIFFISQSIYYYSYVNLHNQPLIDKTEFENILKIDKIIPEDSILMVTHKNYSPWIAGYVYKPTIAPGLFMENKWNLEEWKLWWDGDGEVKCNMIQDYKDLKKPLYLWIGKRQFPENLDNQTCFEAVISGVGYALLKVNFE